MKINKTSKIILSLPAIIILVFVFGVRTGTYSDIFLYIFIFPIILILLRNIEQKETEKRFIYSKIIQGFIFGTIMLFGQLLYFGGFNDMTVFGYSVFFVFFISLIGTQVDQKHEKIRDFFKGVLFSSFIFVIIFASKLIL